MLVHSHPYHHKYTKTPIRQLLTYVKKRLYTTVVVLHCGSAVEHHITPRYTISFSCNIICGDTGTMASRGRYRPKYPCQLCRKAVG